MVVAAGRAVGYELLAARRCHRAGLSVVMDNLSVKGSCLKWQNMPGLIWRSKKP
jgi:hypothetical protein